MDSNGGNSSLILQEIEKLKTEKTVIENRISALQAQLGQNVQKKEEHTNYTPPFPPTVSINGVGFEHGLSSEMIYRYSRQLLLPEFGVQGMAHSKKNGRGNDIRNIDQGNNANMGRATFASNPLKKRYFLELCLKEVNSEGYRGVSLTPTSWTRLEKEFNKKWGTDHHHKVFKNQYDYTRSDYTLWRRLVGCFGHGLSGDLNTLTWSSEKWDEVLLRFPEATKFRNKPLPDVDLMIGIFEGTLAKGESSWRPLSSQKRPTVQRRVEPTEESGTLDATFSENMDDHFANGAINDTPNIVEYTPNTPTMHNDIGSAMTSGTASQALRKKRRTSLRTENLENLERLINIIKEQVREEKASKGPTFDEVTDVMNDLRTIEVITSYEYFAAKVKFGNVPEMMKAFMAEKNKADRVKFLKFMLSGP